MTAKSLKHKFQSVVVDAGTAGEISPNDWNDDHDLRLGGRTVTAATDTIVTGDELSLIKYNSASAIAVALAAPGGANFPSGWTTFLRNAGAGAVTITVTGATVNGAGTLVLNSGNGATLFSDGTNYDAIVSAVSSGNSAAPQGRLTLQSATPVMTTTQSAKTTIYYTPYQGNLVPIYDGTSFSMTAFSELSVLTTDTTKSPIAIGASKVNDWFVWNNAGTLRIGHGPDWTDDVTRSAGTALVRVGGLWLNNASITNGPAASRGTYVGTTRSNAASQLDWIYGDIAAGGIAGFFGVWNCYNRRPVFSMVRDNTDSWTWTGATWRAPNGSANMRTSFVIGLQEDAITAEYFGIATMLNSDASIGIGFDATNIASGIIGFGYPGGANIIQTMIGKYGTVPAIGFHYVSALEMVSTATTTLYGDAGALSMQSGLTTSLFM